MENENKTSKGLTLDELNYLCGYLARVSQDTYGSPDYERKELKKILRKLRGLKQ